VLQLCHLAGMYEDKRSEKHKKNLKQIQQRSASDVAVGHKVTLTGTVWVSEFCALLQGNLLTSLVSRYYPEQS